MENMSHSGTERSLDETIQENVDTLRLLKIGLRNHDPNTINGAISRLSDQYGEEFANDMVFETINALINIENWSFQLENGDSSPLL